MRCRESYACIKHRGLEGSKDASRRVEFVRLGWPWVIGEGRPDVLISLVGDQTLAAPTCRMHSNGSALTLPRLQEAS